MLGRGSILVVPRTYPLDAVKMEAPYAGRGVSAARCSRNSRNPIELFQPRRQ